MNIPNKSESQKGQAIIEFALILPILFLIIGGIIEFGLLFYNKQVLTNACREGVRAGTIKRLDTNNNRILPDIDSVVQNYCNQKMITFGASTLPQVSPETTPSGLDYPSDLTVTVTYQYRFLMSSIMNVFGADVGPTIQIAAATTMKME